MEIIRTVDRLRKAVAEARAEGKTIGLVPTMGALHDGHMSLMRRARGENDVVVASVFVNPTQFNNREDLATYPRTEEADCEKLESAGVDIAFIPSVEEVYPEPDTRQFALGAVAETMEGAMRPGHFNGVAQVVSKLFAMVEPTRAYFGEKDFQQIAVIRELVRQCDYPLQIVACPIVRDTDGLALSSRNALLTPAHRAAAPLIYKALKEGVESARSMSVDEMKRRVVERIDADPLLQVEYFEVVNADTLEGIDRWSDTFPMRGCIAVQAGNVRLIDNIAIL